MFNFYANAGDDKYVARITEKLPGGKYVLEDFKNRRFIASANSSYTVGLTVLVRSGIIVSEVRKRGIIESFHV